jgi:SAM-dependent methyltransferase
MAEWTQFRDSFSDIATISTSIIADVQRNGYEEPLTEILCKPEEIKITPENLHESISANELNSRKRALLFHFWNEVLVRHWQGRRNLRILSADGLTRLALILRGRYPYFYGGEYLPSEEAKRDFFPIPHLDLHTIELPDERFDLFISGDVFEHLPFLHKALTEIYRVLKPGGVLVSSFPFTPSREATLVRASLSKDGDLIHHEPPEFHGNPVDQKGGSLVFQLPGWDILQTLKAIGFEDAYFTMLASSHYGVTSNGKPGPFILTATKPATDKRPRKRPRDYVNRKPLPEKLCTLIALPRSGTTLITSVFSVHSKFVAVFEPWNSTREFQKLIPTLDDLSKHAHLPDLTGKILFVKETAAQHEYVNNLGQLLESVPNFVPKHVLFALRSPAQTFLSEVSRRKEWWGADVFVDREAFKNWVAKSRVALRLIIQFARQYNGTVIALGSFAAHPEKVLEKLGQRIGVAVEPTQLEYEKHIDIKIIRGDRNISTAPTPIDASKVNFRDEDAALIQPLLTDAGEKKWFEAFQSFYELAEKSGGVLPIAALPDELRSVLTSVQ